MTASEHTSRPRLPLSVGPTIKQVMCPGIRLAEVKRPGLGLLLPPEWPAGERVPVIPGARKHNDGLG